MARIPIEIAALSGLSAVPMEVGPVEASQVYIRGAVLIAVTGELEEGGADPVDIVGIAVHKNPPTNTPEETGQYVPALPMVEFVASIDANAALGTGAIAATDLWAFYGITEDTSGVWYVDKTKTAAADARVRITKLIDPAGTVNGRVRIRFLQVVDLTTAPIATTVYVGND